MFRFRTRLFNFFRFYNYSRQNYRKPAVGWLQPVRWKPKFSDFNIGRLLASVTIIGFSGFDHNFPNITHHGGDFFGETMIEGIDIYEGVGQFLHS